MRHSSKHANDAISASRDYLARQDDWRPLFDDDSTPASITADSAYRLGVFVHTTRIMTELLEAAVARIAELEAAADQREVA